MGNSYIKGRARKPIETATAAKQHAHTKTDLRIYTQGIKGDSPPRIVDTKVMVIPPDLPSEPSRGNTIEATGRIEDTSAGHTSTSKSHKKERQSQSAPETRPRSTKGQAGHHLQMSPSTFRQTISNIGRADTLCQPTSSSQPFRHDLLQTAVSGEPLGIKAAMAEPLKLHITPLPNSDPSVEDSQFFLPKRTVPFPTPKTKLPELMIDHSKSTAPTVDERGTRSNHDSDPPNPITGWSLSNLESNFVESVNRLSPSKAESVETTTALCPSHAGSNCPESPICHIESTTYPSSSQADPNRTESLNLPTSSPTPESRSPRAAGRFVADHSVKNSMRRWFPAGNEQRMSAIPNRSIEETPTSPSSSLGPSILSAPISIPFLPGQTSISKTTLALTSETSTSVASGLASSSGIKESFVHEPPPNLPEATTIIGMASDCNPILSELTTRLSSSNRLPSISNFHPPRPERTNSSFGTTGHPRSQQSSDLPTRVNHDSNSETIKSALPIIDSEPVIVPEESPPASMVMQPTFATIPEIATLSDESSKLVLLTTTAPCIESPAISLQSGSQPEPHLYPDSELFDPDKEMSHFHQLSSGAAEWTASRCAGISELLSKVPIGWPNPQAVSPMDVPHELSETEKEVSVVPYSTISAATDLAPAAMANGEINDSTMVGSPGIANQSMPIVTVCKERHGSPCPDVTIESARITSGAMAVTSPIGTLFTAVDDSSSCANIDSLVCCPDGLDKNIGVSDIVATCFSPQKEHCSDNKEIRQPDNSPKSSIPKLETHSSLVTDSGLEAPSISKTLGQDSHCNAKLYQASSTPPDMPGFEQVSLDQKSTTPYENRPSTDGPIRRKRGRPRIHPIKTELSVSANKVDAPVPGVFPQRRGRGRPRKGTSNRNLPIQAAARAIDQKPSSNKVEAPFLNVFPQRRRRGRPRKDISNRFSQSSGDSLASNPPTKRQVSSLNFAGSWSRSESPPAPSGRVRLPERAGNPVATPESIPSALEPRQANKRKRGHPRESTRPGKNTVVFQISPTHHAKNFRSSNKTPQTISELLSRVVHSLEEHAAGCEMNPMTSGFESLCDFSAERDNEDTSWTPSSESNYQPTPLVVQNASSSVGKQVVIEGRTEASSSILTNTIVPNNETSGLGCKPPDQDFSAMGYLLKSRDHRDALPCKGSTTQLSSREDSVAWIHCVEGGIPDKLWRNGPKAATLNSLQNRQTKRPRGRPPKMTKKRRLGESVHATTPIIS